MPAHDVPPTATGEPAEVTALLLPVPGAEPLVDAWRRRYDPSATRGVPAHITLLFPFLPLLALSPAVLDRIRALLADHGPLEFDLAGVRRFPAGVLYLAPEPAAPIRALIDAIVDAFPGYPPYGGAFVDIVPHLTVTDQAPPDVMVTVENALVPRLPVRCRIREAWLMAGREGAGPWRLVERFALGPAARTSTSSSPGR
jgi:2'-5' RNA ligase